MTKHRLRIVSAQNIYRLIPASQWSDGEILKHFIGHTLTHHPHTFDMVRCAGAWLQAQRITKNPTERATPMKHVVEAWARLYIHRDAVVVAARMLSLEGYYPCFNISKSLIRPDNSRLIGIKMAGLHQGYGSEAQDYEVGRWTTYRYDEQRMSDRELERMENRVGMVA